MLINLSNHPSTRWGEDQKNSAEEFYGKVVDMPFPNVSPDASLNEIKELAKKTVKALLRLREEEEAGGALTVHIMGEMTLTFNVIRRLRKLNIQAVASTTERNTVEGTDGQKIVQFKFVQFRSYY